MDWTEFIFLGEPSQHLNSELQRVELDRFKHQLAVRRLAAERTDQDIWDLREENDELKVMFAALVQLLVAKQVLTPDEVKNVIASTDPTAKNKIV